MLTFTANQIVAHLIGDYCLQSDWMAQTKVSRDWKGQAAVVAHALCYTIPFLFLTSPTWKAAGMIFASHLIIDHLRLARYVGWIKNFLAPKRELGFRYECTETAFVSYRHQAYTVADTIAGIHCDGCNVKHNCVSIPRTRPEGIATLMQTPVVGRNWPWAACTATGYGPDKPVWMSVWLLIITDNTMHLICNAASLQYLTNGGLLWAGSLLSA